MLWYLLIGYPAHATYRFKAIEHPGLNSIGYTYDIKQDPQGFMWFAGDKGLARFDGTTVKVYTHDENDSTSLAHNAINQLFIGQQGRLWVATRGGVNYFNPETNSFTLFTPSASRVILQGKAGDLWIGFMSEGLKHFSADGELIEAFAHTSTPDGLSGSSIWSIHQQNDGTLWIGTDGGLNRYRPSTKSFQRYSPDTQPPSFSHNFVRDIFTDRHGTLWVGSNRGLNRYDKADDTFIPYENNPDDPTSLSHDLIRGITEDHNGQMWVGTDGGGVYIYHPEQDSFSHYSNNKHLTGSLISNKVVQIYKDKDDNLWFGHSPIGISMLDRFASSFQTITPQDDKKGLSHPAILTIEKSQQGGLWVGTEQGLNYVDLASGSIDQYLHDPKDLGTLSPSPILSVFEDSKGVLWAGTWMGGLTRFDKKHQRFERIKNSITDPNGLMGEEVWGITEDSQGRLWVGTEAALSQYHTESNRFVAHFYNQYTNRWPKGAKLFQGGIRKLYLSHSGQLWLGTDAGLWSFDTDTHAVKAYHSTEQSPGLFKSTGIRDIVEDPQGQIWCATLNAGIIILNKKRNRAIRYTTQDGLADNATASIQIDGQGHAWIGTAKGLSKFNPQTQTFRTYTQRHGIAGNFFSRAARHTLSSGRMVFGSSEGLTFFNPENIHDHMERPSIKMIDFKILNQKVEINQADSPLTSTILTTRALELNHQHAVFSFEYVAIDFQFPKQVQYAYRLLGFDQKWQYVGNRRLATYTNISPGEYIFQVKAANEKGQWNEQGLSIDIRIFPPWWLSWWAKAIYLVLFASVIGLVMYTYLQRKRVEDEYRVSEKLRDLDKMKDTFLANTSHELRTPLNGIIGLSDATISQWHGTLPEQVNNNLKLIVNSSKRLAYLIDDILDFSKLKEHTLRLNRHPVDLYTLVNSIIQLTQPLVGPKPLTLINQIDKYLASVLADEHRLQQILYNLVGNAIKFTHEGSVTISAKLEGDLLWLEITDTGIGIADDKIAKVFDAFEQVDDTATRHVTGTGLGLAVTKQLVELHGGMVELQSTVNVGTTVRFSLTPSDHTVNETALPSQDKLPARDSNEAFVTPRVPKTDNHSDKPHHILVVDDEPINREVLFSLLALESYQVSQCASGQQAIETLNQPNHTIDLVLLDVMMPGISGYQVCKTLRKTHSINQLPILFLTAKTQVRDLEEAYAVGGNDFLSKPIIKEDLFARLKTHLRLLNVNRQIENKVKQRTQALEQRNVQLTQAHEELTETYKRLKQSHTPANSRVNQVNKI